MTFAGYSSNAQILQTLIEEFPSLAQSSLCVFRQKISFYFFKNIFDNHLKDSWGAEVDPNLYDRQAPSKLGIVAIQELISLTQQLEEQLCQLHQKMSGQDCQKKFKSKSSKT